MDDAPTLELRIQDNSENAVSGILSLANSLSALKVQTSTGLGLDKVVKQLENFNKKFQETFNDKAVESISKVADALERLTSIHDIKIPEISFGKGTKDALTEAVQPEDLAQGFRESSVSAVNDELRAYQQAVTSAQAEIVPQISEADDKMLFYTQTIEDQKAVIQSQRIEMKALNDKLLETAKAQTASAQAIKDNTNSFKGLKNTISQAISPLDKVAKAFKRILFYRVIRSMLREIAQGFSEGLKNVREYSKAINGSFNTAMTTADNALLKMKNSIGAALAPAIESLIPLLQTLTSWFITLVNYVNQFFALLSGKTTWTKAVDASAESLEKTKKSASGAAKAVKNLLAGFDELNIIQSESGGGGGGAGAINTDAYKNMFEEETEFNSKIKELVGWLKDNGPLVRDVVLTIGAALATWKIARALPTELGQVLRLVVGLYIAYEGLSKAYGAFIDQWNNGVDWENMKQLVGGVLITSVGLGLAFGTVGFGAALLVGGITMAINPLKELLETGQLSEESIAQLGIAAIFAGAGITILATKSLKAGVGVAVAIYGVIEAIKDIKNQWENGVTFENMRSLFEKLGIVALGMWLAFGTAGLGVGLLVDGLLAAVAPIKEWIETGHLTQEAAEQLGYSFVLVAAGATLLATKSLKAGVGVALAGYFMVETLKDVKKQWDNGVTFENMNKLFADLIGLTVGLGIAFGTKGIGIAAVVGGLEAIIAPMKELIETGSLSEESFKQLEIGLGLIASGLTVLTGNPWILLIGAIIAGVTALIHYWPEIVNWWETEAQPFLQSLWDTVYNSPTLGPVIKGIESAINAIVEVSKDPIGYMQNMWDTLVAYVEEKWEELGTTLSGEWEVLKTKAKELWDTFVYNDPTLGPIVKGIENAVKTIMEIAEDPEGWWDRTWTNIASAVSEKWTSFTAEIVSWWEDDVLPTIQRLWNSFLEQPVVKPIADAVRNAMSVIKQISDDPQAWWDATWISITGSVASKFEEVKATAAEFWNSLVEQDPALKSTVEWFRVAIEDIRSFFADPGEFISNKWNQFAESFAQRWDEIVREIDTKARADQFIGPIITFIEDAWPKVLSFFDDPAKVFQDAWEGVKTWFHNTIVVPFANFFINIGNNAIDIVNKVIEALNKIPFLDLKIEPIKKLDLMQEIIPEEDVEITFTPSLSEDVDLSGVISEMEKFSEMEIKAPDVEPLDTSGITDGITSAANVVHNEVNDIIKDINRLNNVNPGIVSSYSMFRGGAGGSKFATNMFRAGGGFVGTGEMFIAREAGPELVGRIGNRTAVANNDQIVSGVASGVAAGQSEQNSLLRQQNDLLRQMLAKSGRVEAVPSADWGRFVKRSSEMYAYNTGM